MPASPYRDPDGSLTEAGLRGLDVFLAAGCTECHSGPDFTDSPDAVLHDVGTIRETSGSRLGGTLEGLDTPTLRGIWQTAPYLHDGSAMTLREVLTSRNPNDQHGATVGLTEEEISDLESYLLQIDNTPLEDEAALEPAEPGEPTEPVKPSGSRSGCSMEPRVSGQAPFLWIYAAFGIAVATRLGRRRSSRA
jgi:Cytochrome c